MSNACLSPPPVSGMEAQAFPVAKSSILMQGKWRSTQGISIERVLF